ncbi:ABC transporter ATP-binding protein [Embleya scabrispora]|uniref:ABC transporter ATP-binding protein n=1 Tax=Embleya scabrispora TaxID=159449 RepID=UPI000477644F|nr:ABC transporter ATP-binding protein [Embleya scabrispora]MYS81302.1 ATP-binding cassette domain-containing protein [Streptomyces sp. SID5474]
MMNYAGDDAIRAEGLRVVRGGRVVLDDVSFGVPRGSVTGLLGPSGCGKSTLMRAIVGVQAHVSGRLDVLGRPAGHAGLRSTIGYVTQAPSVYADLTVRENLRYFGSILGAAAGEVDRVLGEVDLIDRQDAAVARLSGGQRARVSLAAALLGAPELLVLDEPTVGLDPVLRRDLWGLFHRLAAGGVTLLVSSHVMDEAERCERLLLLREGVLLADETPAALLARTGTQDAESAFLTLVEAAAGPGSTAAALSPSAPGSAS